LAEILAEILRIGRESFGSHVEVEFAVNLFNDKTKKPEFYLLQIRPMVTGRESVEIAMECIKTEETVVMSKHSMGNGLFTDMCDLVYVDPDTFDRSKTRQIAHEVETFNKHFNDENKNYILIGFGRWGTTDPWLGIPVEWHQISRARMIIESNIKDFSVEPSLGSHFFHNLTSLGLGYFHIAKTTDKEFILWDWFKSQKPFKKTKYVKHLRFSNPFEVKINARNSAGVILRPGF